MTTFSGDLRAGVFPAMQQHTYADQTTEPFWEAAREDRLVAQQCAACGTFRLPPSPLCWKCQSFDAAWTELPGTGTVYTFMVVRQPLHPDLAPIVPYVSGVVELDGTQGEGARMLVNIIDVDPEEMWIGMPVQIVFEHLNDDMAVARFRPTGNVPNRDAEE